MNAVHLIFTPEFDTIIAVMDPLHQIVAAVKARDAASLRKLLSERPDLAGARDETGDSILLMAIYAGDAALLDVILAHNPEVSVFEAAALGNTPVVKDRLARFPELVRAFSHDGFTALHLAAHFGRAETARVLLDAGAAVDAPSTNQTLAHRATPLHSAVAGRRKDVAILLLSRGADVNARQEGGFTPLHGAAAAGDEAIVRELLARGADRHARTDDHRTPADAARDAGHADVATLLE